MQQHEPYSPDYWKAEIRAYEQSYRPWGERVRKIIDLYRDAGPDRPDQTSKYRYNLFWSNIQTTRPALYSRTPKPVVEERLKDGNPLVRFAAHIWEKAIEYNLKSQKFDSVMGDAVSDYLMCARGVTWCYLDQTEGEPIGQDVDGSPLNEVIDAQAKADFVLWKDFGHTVDRRWSEVRAVWRKVYLTEARFKERFGDRKVSFDHKPEHLDKAEAERAEGKACIYEIWCKETRKAYWLHLDETEFLDEREDPLRLGDFFPCPQPLYATNTTDTLIPLPDYAMTQDMYMQLDKLSQRISRLESAVRVCGARDAGSEELDRILTEDLEGFVPVKDWPTYLQAGGMNGVIDFLPLDQIVKALQTLYEARERLKASLDELTGTSDLVRGNTNAAETATAQQLKSNYQNLRIGDRQREVQRFARDIIEIQAEIIAEHFPPEMIAGMAGIDLSTPEMQQQFMAAMDLLRNDRRRRFYVNIETDSTISLDEAAEKEAVSELFQALSQFLQQFLQFGQMAPEFLPALGQLLVFAMRRFRAGRTVEDSFEQAVGQFLQGQQQRMAQPQQDPAAVQLQAQMQVEQQRTQMESAKFQQSAQMEVAKLQQAAQVEQARLQQELQRTQQELQIKVAELQAANQKSAEELALKKYELDAKLALEREKMAATAAQMLARGPMEMEGEEKEEKTPPPPPLQIEVNAAAPKRRIVMDNGRWAEIQDVPS